MGDAAVVTNYASQRGNPLSGPLEDQGEPGWRPGPGESADGATYIAERLIELGWSPHGARRWAAELVMRCPYLCSDDYRNAAEVADMLHVTVPDPAHWDSHGAVLNVLEWYWRSR